MIVSGYGLHTAGGIPFLVQQGGAQNLISPDLASPFMVQTQPRRMRCPHQIDLSDHADADWINDPLAQVFLPVPRRPGEKPKLIQGVDNQLLLDLQRLCTPTEPLIRPVWWRATYRESRIYELTNIGPLVFLVMDPASDDVVRQLHLAEANNRRVLFATRDRLPIFDGEWITTELKNVGNEPLERIGAGALRRHMLALQSEH